MALEIERKFLVKNDRWKALADAGTRFSQGYLCDSGPGSVRVRVEGDRANINIKSATIAMQRHEFEYEIPLPEAEEMLSGLCIRPIIEKTRFLIPAGTHTWEIDVFEGDNAGLVVAEIELAHAGEHFEKPDWLGEEVTEDTRYYNVCLVKHPFKDW